MKNIIQNINKAFDHRIRLGIMSVLMVNEYADFNMLKELLGVTDGNLASHTKALESEEYIAIEKQFEQPRPTWRVWARALRVHQWVKNLLIFVPLLTSFEFDNASKCIAALLAFIAFSMATTCGTWTATGSTLAKRAGPLPVACCPSHGRWLPAAFCWQWRCFWHGWFHRPS